MFFSQTIRDLFSKINSTNETVRRIDKDAGIVASSQKILIKDCQELKDDFKKHVGDPQGCSSSGDISFLMDDKLAQNGKIDRWADRTKDQGASIDNLTKTSNDQNGKIDDLTNGIATLTTAIGDINNRKKWSHEWRTDLIKFILMIVAMGGFLIPYDKWRTSKLNAATIAAKPTQTPYDGILKRR